MHLQISVSVIAVGTVCVGIGDSVFFSYPMAGPLMGPAFFTYPTAPSLHLPHVPIPTFFTYPIALAHLLPPRPHSFPHSSLTPTAPLTIFPHSSLTQRPHFFTYPTAPFPHASLTYPTALALRLPHGPIPAIPSLTQRTDSPGRPPRLSHSS